MTFDEVWTSVAINAVLSVSNGKPEPPAESPRHAIWRSHNFTGPLLEKIESSPRKLRIEAVNEPGLVVAYEVVEGMGHAFALAE